GRLPRRSLRAPGGARRRRGLRTRRAAASGRRRCPWRRARRRRSSLPSSRLQFRSFAQSAPRGRAPSRYDRIDTKRPCRPMAVLLLTKPTPPEAIAKKIREIAPDIRCIERREDADPAEIDAILGWSIREGYAATLPNLKLVCANAAGVEKLMTADLPESVPVTRIVDPLVNLGIAQHVATMALWHARGF